MRAAELWKIAQEQVLIHKLMKIANTIETADVDVAGRARQRLKKFLAQICSQEKIFFTRLQMLKMKITGRQKWAMIGLKNTLITRK